MQGAEGVAAALFGTSNRFGRMPITIYPSDYVNEVWIPNPPLPP